jgi:hemerythrin superfamily protein
MPATQKAAASKSTSKSAAKPVLTAVTPSVTPSTRKSPTRDAVALLKADHKEVKGLFKAYQDLVDAEAESDERQQLAQRICGLLTVHATIEEELFYSPAREALGEDGDLVDEADVEHASAKQLIAEIEGSTPDDQHYDARVKVLGEYIEHHVSEEEGEMFPKVKKTDLDLDAIGEALAARKEELMQEKGLMAPTDLKNDAPTAPGKRTRAAKAN